MGKVVPLSASNFSAPEIITPAHDLRDFDCGKPSLDKWLRKHAVRNNGSVSRTFVVCIGNKVAGYYTLAAGSVGRADSPKRLQQNSPETIPVIVLGRLAVDQKYQKQGLGRSLLRDALLRCLRISQEVGVRAMLVHAIDDDVIAFYKREGFIPSAIQPRTLLLPLDQVRAALGM